MRKNDKHDIHKHKKQHSNKQMKKFYEMPTIELEELVVESGIAQSLNQSVIEDWDQDGGVTIGF